MRSAIWSRQSAWELRNAGPPMTFSMGMFLVRSPSSQTVGNQQKWDKKRAERSGQYMERARKRPNPGAEG